MRPYLLMLAGAIAFSCMSELAHALNERCHWMIVALGRTLLALIFTTAWARLRGVDLVFWRPRTLWMRSLAGSVSLLCTFYAFHHLPASDVVAVTNMFPIWVAVLSWPMLGIRPHPIVWLSVVAAVCGAWLINRPGLDEAQAASAAASGASHFGVAAATVSSVLSAVVVIGLNLLHRLPSQAIVVHFSAVATVFCLAAMPLADVGRDDFAALTPSTVGLLLAMGLSATVGQLFLTMAFAAGEASRVAVVALSQVVLCFLFEIGFLGRSFPWTSMWGMILIVGPTAWLLLRREADRGA